MSLIRNSEINCVFFSKAVVEDEEGSDEEDAADPTVTEAIVRYNIRMPGTSYTVY
jgi:hypothetical protein